MYYAHKSSFLQFLYRETIKALNLLFPNLLIVFFLFFLVLGLYMINEGNIGDFGMNFLSEMAGIFVTVYIVELFYRGMKKQKKVPARAILWKDLSKIFDQYFLLWKATYEKTGIPVDNTIEDVFDEKIFLQMMKKLDIDNSVEPNNGQNWCDLIHNTVSKSQVEIQELVNKHYNDLEPQLLAALKEFADGDFTGSLIELKNLRKLRVLKDSKFHSVSLKPERCFFENTIAIYHWIMIEQKKLRTISKDRSLSTSYSMSIWKN